MPFPRHPSSGPISVRYSGENNPTGSWRVTDGGNAGNYDSKDTAVRKAKQSAKSAKRRLVVYKQDGSVQFERNYSDSEGGRGGGNQMPWM